MALNAQGVKAPVKHKKAPKPPTRAPADLRAALKKSKKAAATYDAFGARAKREYIETTRAVIDARVIRRTI